MGKRTTKSRGPDLFGAVPSGPKPPPSKGEEPVAPPTPLPGGNKPLDQMAVDELERAVEFHDYQYWVLDQPLIPDEEYDLLVRRLEELKPDSPVLRRVGGGFAAETFRNKVTHAVPMLSLDKCYDEEKYWSWLRNIVGRTLRGLVESRPGEFPGYAAFAEAREEALDALLAELPVAVSPKIDGVAASLRYGAQGNLEQAATRGDGTQGEDFTVNARLVSGIPWQVRRGGLEVRGEVYMRRSVFREKYAESFPNPRNLTAGTLKQKESNRAQILDLSFYAYDILGVDLATEAEKRALLRELGFEPVETALARAGDAPSHFEQALAAREGWDYDGDGLVVRLDDVRLQQELGATAHHPRHAIAFKFQGDEGITILEAVEWSVSRSAIITPVAIVRPVFLSGASVSRSTLHNIKEFSKLGLHVGDRVRLKRRGDVIPKVEGNLGGGGEVFGLPTACPSCGAETLLAAPQLFINGMRLQRHADTVQLEALVGHMQALAADVKPPKSEGLFAAVAPEEVRNTLARRHGDLRYKELFTWGRGESEGRREILERLRELPATGPKSSPVLALLVTDPGLEASRRAAAEWLPVLAALGVQVRTLTVASSRLEGAGDAQAEPAYRLAEDVLVCSSPATCRQVRLGRLEHFIQTLGVDGFGGKIIENLYDNGLLDAPDAFFALSAADLVGLERMGEILATKLVANVQAARRVPPGLFLQALGIEELARHVATLLEREYGDLDRILALKEEELVAHDSIAFGIAHQVVHGLRRQRELIDRLRPLLEIEAARSPATASGLPFSGRSFLFTGKMRTLQRKEAQAMVEELGGEAPGGVTTDLSYLVVGDEGSPLFGEGAKGNKMKKAEAYNARGATIEIISESRFLEMVEAARSEHA
jgi:NAD-dependent DNA ligase